jgi:hypothetical protein
MTGFICFIFSDLNSNWIIYLLLYFNTLQSINLSSLLFYWQSKMTKYMVCIDGSQYARKAFYHALFLIKNKEKDHLYLLHVLSHYQSAHPYEFVTKELVYKLEEVGKREARELLESYAILASAQHINFSLILGVSNHIAEMIVKEGKPSIFHF